MHAQLQDRLSELGYPSWTSYRMGNGLATVEPDLHAEFKRSMTDLEQAETDWAELMAQIERDEELSDVLGAIEQVHDRAMELIGAQADADDDTGPEALAERLWDHTVPASSVAIDPLSATDQLLEALDDNGAIGHRSLMSDQALLAAGEAWLEVLRSADDAAVRVLRDWERAEEERSAIAEIEPQSGADLIADARERLAVAEASVAELRRALCAIANTRRDLYVLATTELLVAEDHDAKLELLGAARTIERSARSRVSSDSETKERTGIAALVPRGIGGPIPIVIDIGTETAALARITGESAR